MRETTSERQIEGPAFVMSEAGARMFFNFCLSIANGNNCQPENDVPPILPDVNDFLQRYDKHKQGATEPGSDPAANVPTKGYDRRKAHGRRRDYKAERKSLFDILYGKGPTNLSVIWEEMNGLGLWYGDQKSATSSIKAFMKHYPDTIYSIGRGLYHWPAEDEIVLKFKDPEGAQHETE